MIFAYHLETMIHSVRIIGQGLRYNDDVGNLYPIEFERVRKQAGASAFTMSPKKWIEGTEERRCLKWIYKNIKLETE